MLPISLLPSAHSAASSIAIPALMSGDSTRSPRSLRGPVTIARCGSHITMSAPIRISLSVKIKRFSNIHSCTRIDPSACVASATAIEVRSAGNAGHGPSWIFHLYSPTSACTVSFCSARHEHVVAVQLAAQPQALEHQPDHPQVAGNRVLDPHSPPVTPASAMKLPISMWSGATSCSQPCSSFAPFTVIKFEPIP